jgi:hypothetical protein
MSKYLGFFIALVVGVFLLASSIIALAGEEKKMGGKEATITGQVVDPACYIAMNLKGESHKQCAIACAKAGQAFGILDEKAGMLYQVIESAPGTDPNKLLWDHTEGMVTIKGMVFEKNGMHAIVPTEVKPAGS